MSTELRNVSDSFSQTRFWGGEERGVCVQVTQQTTEGFSFVSLNREEAGTLARELFLFSTGSEVDFMGYVGD